MTVCSLRVHIAALVIISFVWPAHGVAPKILKTMVESPDNEKAFEQLTNSTDRDLTKLVTSLNSRLKENPSSGGIHALLGRLYLHLDQCKEAIAHFEKAQRLLPKATVGPLGLAACTASSENWATALSHFDAALMRAQTKQTRLRIYRKKLRVCLTANDGDTARNTWQRISTILRPPIFTRIAIAEEITDAGNLNLALEAWITLRKAVRNDPKLRLHVTKKTSDVLTRLGRIAEAINSYKKALKKVGPEHWSTAELYEGLLAVHRQAGSMPSLVRWLQKRKRVYPALLTLARIHEELGQDEAALETYREAVKRRPANNEAKLSVLRILKRLGNLRELETEYQRLSERSGSNARFSLELAKLYFQQTNTEAAFRTLDTIIRKYGDDPTALEEVTELYVAHDAPQQKIINLYRRLSRLEPDREDHAIRLGEYFYGKKDNDAAVRTWKRILDIVPSKGRGHMIFARVLAEHDLELDAIREYKLAIKASPKHIRYREAFARWLASVSRYREASEAWKAMLAALPPTDYDRCIYVRAQLVDTLEKHKMLRASIRTWQTRLGTNPLDPSLIALLSAAVFHQNRYGDAIDDLKLAVNKHPENIQLLLYLLEATKRSGNVSEALRIVIRIHELDRNIAGLRLKELSRSSGELYKVDEAIKLAQLYATWSPSDPEALIQVGELQWKNHQYQAAANKYRQAIRLRPDDTSTRLQYALLLEESGQYSQLTSQLVEIAKQATDPLVITEVGRRALRLPGIYALERVADILLELALHQPKRTVYRELLMEIYARWIQRTDLRGRSKKQEQWLNRVIERGLRPITEALKSQNLAARAHALRILNATQPKMAEPSLIRLLSAHDRITRFQSLVILAHIRAANTLRHMGKLIESKDRDISNAAVWSLGVISGNNVSAQIRKIVNESKHNNHLQLAALALGARGHESQVDLALQLHRTKSTREHATWALGSIGGTKALDTVLSLLSAKTASDVEIWAVGAIGAQKAVPTLLKVLLSEPKHRHRLIGWAIQRCLSGVPIPQKSIEKAYLALPAYNAVSLSTGNALQRLLIMPPSQSDNSVAVLESSATTTIVEVLKRGNSAQQLNALRQLRFQAGKIVLTTAPGLPNLTLPNNTQVERLLVQLVSESTGELQTVAMSALSAIGNVQYVSELALVQPDVSASIVRSAVIGLSKNPDKAATQTIRALYDRYSADWSVRLATATALSVKRPLSKTHLEEIAPRLLQDEYASVLLATLRAIHTNDLSQFFRAQIRKLAANNDDIDVQALAQNLLGGTNAPR